jgi:hypothetical protein
VLQHFSRNDVATVVAEIDRVLCAQGTTMIQMPTKFGLRCLFHQVRRGFRDGAGFEVRYWSLPALRKLFSKIGPTSFSVDCFFGIGLQYSDRRLLRPAIKVLVTVSELLRLSAPVIAPLIAIADSVYVGAVRVCAGQQNESPCR